MKWYDSIKVKLLGFFLFISLIFMVAIIITFFYIRASNLQENASKEARLATSKILQHIQTSQTKAEDIVLALASVAKEEFEEKEINDEIIQSILNSDKKESINIISGGVWFEPYSFDKYIDKYELFFSRNKNNTFDLIQDYSSQSKLNYREMEFYTLAKETEEGHTAWTSVYRDPVTNILMITVISPIYYGHTYVGAASVDIIIANKRINFLDQYDGENIYLIMIDKEGNFIGKSKQIRNYIQASNIYKVSNPTLQKLIKKIKPVLMHTIKHTHTYDKNFFNKIYLIDNDPVFKQNSIISVQHFSDTHWNVIIGIPENKVMAQNTQTFRKVLTVVLILTLLATLLGYIILQKLFANPIQSINAQLKENNQHYKLLHCKDKGEIGALVDNLNNRTIALIEAQKREAQEIDKRVKNEEILVQQSKMAAMGEMMDAVAHQWKQPLNALSMYSEIIKNDFEEGEVDQKYINQFKTDIQAQINHMVNTLDEFRTFFRPNKEREMFSLLSIIHSVLFLTKDDLLKNRITIDIEKKDHIDIDGSSNEFKHLVLNIINNAKDAFNDNEIKKRKISIRLFNDTEGKRMEIEDNAGGIPGYIIDDIFKANVTSKEAGKGTGIGLYMSTQIASKHHAVLSVKNQNEGACFTITF